MAVKKAEPDFKPWDREEGRRKKPYRMPSIPKKTNMTARVRSKPKFSGQEYLDLYILLKQKERHEKYGNVLYERGEAVSEEWKDMKKEIYQMEALLPTVPRGGTDEEREGGEVPSKGSKGQKPKPEGPRGLKTRDWDY